MQLTGIVEKSGKVVAIPVRTSANQNQCAKGRSQGFLQGSEMRGAGSLGLAFNLPLNGRYWSDICKFQHCINFFLNGR